MLTVLLTVVAHQGCSDESPELRASKIGIRRSLELRNARPLLGENDHRKVCKFIGNNLPDAQLARAEFEEAFGERTCWLEAVPGLSPVKEAA